MQPGQFEISPAAHVAEVFRPGVSFSLEAPAGDYDAPAFERAYATAIEERLKAHDYADIDIEHDAGGFRVIAFNPDGSSIDVGFSVNDRLGLDVDYASGISVQNGNDIDLLTMGIWEFPSELGYDSLEDFLVYFKEW